MNNTEELKRRFANHLQVSELDTRDGYAVEWTVAAMSNERFILEEDWKENFRKMFGVDVLKMDRIPVEWLLRFMNEKIEAGERK